MTASPFITPPPPTTRLGRAEFGRVETQVFDDALRALDAGGVPYLLGGAFAFNAYTDIWRDTKDLDVFVRPGHVGNAIAALARGGFETQVVYPSWLAKGWRGDVFVDVIWRNANGLFPVTDEWFEHKGQSEIFGRAVPVLPLEELIISKMMVGGRFRWDGADILHLLHANAHRLDWERLARHAGEHVELLLGYLHMYRWCYPGWRERVPDDVFDRFRALAADAAREPRDPFRGTLLDIPTFSVDVRSWGMPDPHERVLDDIAQGRERT